MIYYASHSLYYILLAQNWYANVRVKRVHAAVDSHSRVKLSKELQKQHSEEHEYVLSGPSYWDVPVLPANEKFAYGLYNGRH